MSAQSTDAINSAPLVTAVKAGGGETSSKSRTTQDIAGDDGASTGGDGGQDAVTAPLPQGSA